MHYLPTVLCAAACATALAQDPQASTPPASEGVLPIPDLSGDLFERRALLGDFNGARIDWARSGVQAEVNWWQYGQSVTQGGRDVDTRSGGGLDYLVTLDLMRMGMWPGAMVRLRAESRYENSVNADSGSILPVNTDMFFPLTDEPDEDILLTVTNLQLLQFVTEEFGVLAGKLDTLDCDPNEFASGRGTSQFMNANFVFNAALALRLPYSTLGGGIAWMPRKNLKVTSTVFNTVDSSTTTGFSDIGDGATWTTEIAQQHQVGSLPGGHNVGVLYSWDQDFTKFTGRFVFQPGEGLVLPTSDDTWAVYWSGWQYVSIEDATEAPIDLGNGRPDHQGVGVFARFGFADEDTNHVEWTGSIGIGGRGIFTSRDDDTFGAGYYYTSLQTARLAGFLGLDDQVQGVEVFYDFAITPAVHVTIDAQVVESVATNLDTAVIVGARFGCSF